MSPEELHPTGFVDGVAGVVISTNQIACWAGARRELDFIVVSKPVAALVTHVVRDEYFVTRPHDALRLFLNPKAFHMQVPVAVRFAKGACVRPAGPALSPRLCAWQWQALSLLCNTLATGGMKDAWGARISHRTRSLPAVAPTLRRSCIQALGARDAQGPGDKHLQLIKEFFLKKFSAFSSPGLPKLDVVTK
eukprot:5311250-Amphidinium_carterae.1